MSPMRFHVRPDFLIIGAQKAGTTSLYSWLATHRDVIPARRKELHFFDSDPAKNPIELYWAKFPTRLRMATLRAVRRRPVVTGEATPYYLFHPLVPERVHRHLPNVKLIVLLRDPAERAISHYGHVRRDGEDPLPLQEALAREQERIQPELDRAARGQEPSVRLARYSYVARGRYAEQLDRWLALFDRSQLLILQFERLAVDPASVYEEALEFLGVEPATSPPPSFHPQNVGSPHATDPGTLEWLRDRLRPHNQVLADRFGIDYT